MMDSESSDTRETLQEVLRFSTSIMTRLKGFHSPSTKPGLPENSIPRFTVALPPEILLPLKAFPLPKNIINFVLRRFERLVHELQQDYATAYTRACMVTSQRSNYADVHRLYKVYQALYISNCIPLVKARVSSVVAQMAHYQPISCQTKRPFNNEFTPCLETYFHYNAYPSLAHRKVLAERSNMTSRQIEVWFQNHRNRAKKEGRKLQRLQSDFPLNRAIELSEVQIKHYEDHPSPVQESEENEGEEDIQPTSCLEVKNLKNDPFRPCHVFPAHFSACSPDTNSSNRNADGTFKFPSPIWMRRPTSNLAKPTIVVDMEEFISLFSSKLSFLDKKRSASPSDPPISQTLPWFTSTVTIPPRGCHPALISIPVTSAGSEISCPMAPSLNASPLPLQLSVGSRKVTTNNAFRGFSTKEPLSFYHYLPSTSHRHPSSLTSKSSSRASSFSSDVSFGNRICSSTSGHSSPEPSTPPHLPESDPSVNLEEFFLEDYDFDVFTLINHPDFIDMENLRNQQQILLPDKQPDTATINPSLLTYSHPYTILQDSS